jgi:hypothetical protein
MSRLRVKCFSVSLDGFGAGPSQDLDHPLGVGGPDLFSWFFHTRTWKEMQGSGGGETGVDDGLAAQGKEHRCVSSAFPQGIMPHTLEQKM